jgi:hypothetical protein
LPLFFLSILWFAFENQTVAEVEVEDEVVVKALSCHALFSDNI